MLRFLNFFLNQLKFILKLQKIGIEPITGLQIRVCYDFFLISHSNIYCEYSKELTQWNGSFEHQKLIF